MSMIKRANGEIETFTDEEGKEVVAQSQDVVWADEKDEKFKDEIRIPVVADFALDIDASDDDDETIAKDC